MADKKLSELTADPSPGADSLLYTVDDPAGTASSHQSTVAQVLSRLADVVIAGASFSDSVALSGDPSISSEDSLEIRIDSDSNSTTQAFSITKDTGYELLKVEETGQVTTPGKLHFNSDDTNIIFGTGSTTAGGGNNIRLYNNGIYKAIICQALLRVDYHMEVANATNIKDVGGAGTYYTFSTADNDNVTGPVMRFFKAIKWDPSVATNPAIFTTGSLDFRIDSNNDSTDKSFIISKGDGTSSGDILLSVKENGCMEFPDDVVKIGTDTLDSGSGTYAIAIGNEALKSASSDYGIGIGYGAGRDSSSATISIGRGAGEDSDQGTVSVGYYAGYQSTGVENVLIGTSAGYQLDSSSTYNVLIGHESGKNLDGSTNVSIGQMAGHTYDGSESVLLGYFAGLNAAGENNIFLGANSGMSCVGSNNIELVTDGATTSILDDCSNKLHIENTIVGDTSAKKLAIGNVGSGDVVPDATLELKPNAASDVGLIIQGAISQSANLTEWQDSAEVVKASVDEAGVALFQKIILSNLPTSDPGSAGQVWNDSGTLKISDG